MCSNKTRHAKLHIRHGSRQLAAVPVALGSTINPNTCLPAAPKSVPPRAADSAPGVGKKAPISQHTSATHTPVYHPPPFLPSPSPPCPRRACTAPSPSHTLHPSEVMPARARLAQPPLLPEPPSPHPRPSSFPRLTCCLPLPSCLRVQSL